MAARDAIETTAGSGQTEERGVSRDSLAAASDGDSGFQRLRPRKAGEKAEFWPRTLSQAELNVWPHGHTPTPPHGRFGLLVFRARCEPPGRDGERTATPLVSTRRKYTPCASQQGGTSTLTEPS